MSMDFRESRHEQVSVSSDFDENPSLLVLPRREDSGCGGPNLVRLLGGRVLSENPMEKVVADFCQRRLRHVIKKEKR